MQSNFGVQSSSLMAEGRPACRVRYTWRWEPVESLPSDWVVLSGKREVGSSAVRDRGNLFVPFLSRALGLSRGVSSTMRTGRY